MKQIDFEKIYESNSNGKFKIIKDLGYIDGRHIIRILFINTGTIKNVRYDLAMQGAISDDLHGIDFEKTYYSNLYGPFIILEFAGRDSSGRKLVLIKFLYTGFKKVITYKAAKYGYAVDDSANITHPLDTNVFDIYEREKIVKRKTKQTWKELVNRCTNPKSQAYKYYGEIGVSIDNSWLDFECFYNDIQNLYQFDKYYRFPFTYQIDKDYLQQDICKCNRIYSKNTCVFLHKYDNINMQAIEYRNNHINELSSQYFGVNKTPSGMYRASIIVNGKNISIGTYDSEIAAANAFNYWFEKYHHYELIPLYNEVPYMSQLEFTSHNTNIKEMIRLIKNK